MKLLFICAGKALRLPSSASALRWLLIAASYWAMRLNAATLQAKRVLSLVRPSACNSASTPAYWAASVSTVTSFQFLAALRTMAGPPMSMFSIASSSVQPGLATVASNGYRVTARMSIVSMPWAWRAATCSGRSRRASRPPWIFGCSVFTRPSSISGKPVCSATSVTGRPASASSLAVPPVDSRRTFSACRAWANSTMPVLSDTEIRAVSCDMGGLGRFGVGSEQLVLGELAAQRVAVDAEPVGGLALVALGLGHHHLEQRALDEADQHFVHGVRLLAAEVAEIDFQVLAHA